jgi:hypothetical protein
MRLRAVQTEMRLEGKTVKTCSYGMHAHVCLQRMRQQLCMMTTQINTSSRNPSKDAAVKNGCVRYGCRKRIHRIHNLAMHVEMRSNEKQIETRMCLQGMQANTCM